MDLQYGRILMDLPLVPLLAACSDCPTVGFYPESSVALPWYSAAATGHSPAGSVGHLS